MKSDLYSKIRPKVWREVPNALAEISNLAKSGVTKSNLDFG